MTSSDDWSHERAQLTTALELMANAGWIGGFAVSSERGVAIEWTEAGERNISLLRELIGALSPDLSMDKEVLWAVRTILVLQFGKTS